MGSTVNGIQINIFIFWHPCVSPGAAVGPAVVGIAVVVGAAVTNPSIPSPLIDSFLPVFLYFPVTAHPFAVSIETETPLVHLDFLGVQVGVTFETVLQSSM